MYMLTSYFSSRCRQQGRHASPLGYSDHTQEVFNVSHIVRCTRNNPLCTAGMEFRVQETEQDSLYPPPGKRCAISISPARQPDREIRHIGSPSPASFALLKVPKTSRSFFGNPLAPVGEVVVQLFHLFWPLIGDVLKVTYGCRSLTRK